MFPDFIYLKKTKQEEDPLSEKGAMKACRHRRNESVIREADSLSKFSKRSIDSILSDGLGSNNQPNGYKG